MAFATLSLILSPSFGAGPDMPMAPSIPTTPPSTSTGATPLSPSTAASDTTKATEHTTIPGGGGRLCYKEDVSTLLQFQQQLKEGKLVWRCEPDGELVLTSKPDPEITVESVLKNLGEPPLGADPKDIGLHDGYVIGLKDASEGRLYLDKFTHKFTKLKVEGNEDDQIWSDKYVSGVYSGYEEGYQANAAIVRLQQYEGLER